MIASIDGAPFHYVDNMNASPTPVIFLHGFPFSHEMWEPQLDLVGRTHRAIAYDLRGHGLSFVGDGQFTIEGHVDDLMAMLDTLKIQKTIIVGLSMGGYITLRALERNPERFIAAVLCDTRSESDTNEARLKRAVGVTQVKKDGSAAFADGFVKVLFAEESLKTKTQQVETIRRIISATPPLSIAGTLIALVGRTDTTASLATIKIPTLILVGEHDAITPPSAARSLHEKIAGSEMHIVPHAGHMSNLESTEFFNEKLLAFLKRIS